MEMNSPPPCPNSVTVRRNPTRRARATPSSAAASQSLPPPPPSSTKTIPSFPIEDILSINIPPNSNQLKPPTPPILSIEDPNSENLKVFLRIRPLDTNQGSIKHSKNGPQATKSKNVWPQNPNAKTAPKAKPKKKSEICLKVNDSHSVTLCPSQSLQDQRRIKTEIYEGFSHVFSANSSQDEVYERMVNPLVEDFLKGKSGMFAALGPSGSGKTHTVFGSVREPGMVPLALRRIFSQAEGKGRNSSRTFYLSMFEILSERGKGEKVLDLSQDGDDVCLQQSTIKGLQEAAIFDVQHAESLIARGMLKRATAMTNSNSQSSRSQCIINIRCGLNKIDVESGAQSNSALLTIVDLAGAEREKRTGNQGARLLESNFINNTSMVFGLCLRSLLEHQKNPKKPLQKHFQSSLLTRYLRDYLEGKKRMTLILTVKSGEEDYTDASFLLRQASPFMNIKFDVVEEPPSNSFGNKRQFQAVPKAGQLKRMKFTNDEASTGDEGKGGGTQFRKEGCWKVPSISSVSPPAHILATITSLCISIKEKMPLVNITYPCFESDAALELVKEVEPANTLVQSPSIISLEANGNASLNELVIELANRDREHQIMINFGKALWNVLKDYKKKLEVAENEIHGLKESLAVEKERCSALEDALNGMKSCCSCGKEVMADVSPVEVHESVAMAGCQSTVINEVAEDEIHCLRERLAVEVERFSELENKLNDMKSCCSCGKEVSEEVSQVEVGESRATEFAETERCQSTSVDEVHVQVSSSNLEESHSIDDKQISDSTAGKSIVISTCAVENSVEQTCQICDDTQGNVGCYDKLEDHKHKDRETSSEVTGCVLPESVVRSLQSHVLAGDDSSMFMEGDQLQHEEEVNEQISSLNLKESENTDGEGISNSTLDNPMIPAEDMTNSVVCSAGNVSEREAKNLSSCQAFNPGTNQIVPTNNLTNSEMCSASVVSRSEVTLPPSCNPVNPGKPKRRLQPASSILLKNINGLEFDDENEKPKGTKKEKKAAADITKKTQGNIALLRLLTDNLHL